MSSSQLTNSIIFQRGRAQPPSSFSWDTMQEITGNHVSSFMESRRIAMNRRTSHHVSEIGMGNFSLDHDAFFFSSFHHHFKWLQKLQQVQHIWIHFLAFSIHQLVNFEQWSHVGSVLAAELSIELVPHNPMLGLHDPHTPILQYIYMLPSSYLR